MNAPYTNNVYSLYKTMNAHSTNNECSLYKQCVNIGTSLRIVTIEMVGCHTQPISAMDTA